MGRLGSIIVLVLTGFGAFFGFSASFTFMLFYSNYHAAVWGFISGAIATVNFHLILLYLRGVLDSWHSVHTLREINLLGFLALMAGTVGTIWYLFNVFYLNLPILPIDDSMQIAAVWTFMTAKWGAGLYFTTNQYIKYLQELSPSLLPASRY